MVRCRRNGGASFSRYSIGRALGEVAFARDTRGGTAFRAQLATKIGPQGATNFKPEDLVFQEDPTTLFAADGTTIKS